MHSYETCNTCKFGYAVLAKTMQCKLTKLDLKRTSN